MTWREWWLRFLLGFGIAAILIGPALVIGILLAIGWRLG